MKLTRWRYLDKAGGKPWASPPFTTCTWREGWIEDSLRRAGWLLLYSSLLQRSWEDIEKVGTTEAETRIRQRRIVNKERPGSKEDERSKSRLKRATKVGMMLCDWIRSDNFRSKSNQQNTSRVESRLLDGEGKLASEWKRNCEDLEGKVLWVGTQKELWNKHGKWWFSNSNTYVKCWWNIIWPNISNDIGIIFRNCTCTVNDRYAPSTYQKSAEKRRREDW